MFFNPGILAAMDSCGSVFRRKTMSMFKSSRRQNLLMHSLLGICLALLPLTGCSKKTSEVSENSESNTSSLSSDSGSSTNAGVATIDVTQIANESGALAEINLQLDKKETEFNLILDGLRKIHLDQVTAMEKENGDKPTEAQQREVANLKKKQAAEYNAKWQDTRIKLTAIKQKLDEAFLVRLRPIAQKIAKQNGLSVVIRAENVFCLVDQFDITREVSAAFISKYPKEESSKVIEVAELPSRGGGFEPRK